MQSSPSINWRAMFRAFGRMPLRHRITVTAGLTIASILELAGLTLLIPILTLAGTDIRKGGAKAEIFRAIGDFLDKLGMGHSFIALIGLLVALLSLKAVVSILVMRYIGNLTSKMTTQSRLRLVKALLAAQWSYFTARPLSQLVAGVGHETNAIGESFMLIANLISSLLLALTYFALCALISWPMSLVIIAIALLMGFSYGHLVRRTRQATRQHNRQIKNMGAAFTDVVMGIKAIKAMGREARFSKLFAKDAKALHRAMKTRALSSQFAGEFQEPLIALCLGVGIYIGFTHLTLEPYEYLILAILMLRLIGMFNEIQRTIHRFSGLADQYQSATSLLLETEAAREQAHGATLPSPDLGVRFSKVSFSFSSTKPILSAADWYLQPRQITALMGPSGIGKTTVIDLILGLRLPQEGEVWLGDTLSHRADLTAWRRKIGYVPQEVALFHDTVFHNVTLGEEDYSREDVWQALREARADDFVNTLPQQLDYVVGERGLLLSGGQRQRLAIARALVHRPKILILDEATTGLDRETEQMICHNIQKLVEERHITVLSVTHSEVWRDIADQVVTVSDLQLHNLKTPANRQSSRAETAPQS